MRKFVSAEDMLECLKNGHELYSRTTQIFVFCYNEEGSVCIYYIDTDEAKDLALKCKETNEYWSGHLGYGGHIYDDPSHECYSEERLSNLDILGKLYLLTDWIECSQFLDSEE